MTGEELEVRCIKLFGKKHWEKILAEKTGRVFSTIWRWRRNERPVPRFVEILLETIESKNKLDRIKVDLARKLK